MNYTNRSPTESLESRLRWARKERCILEMLHEQHPPTHEATIKFVRPVEVRDLRDFQRRIRQSYDNWRKRSGEDFAVYLIREIEPNNCVHYHLLIRTTLSQPWAELRRFVGSASRGLASVPHCRTINNVFAFTRYIVKDLEDVRDGSKELLLFKPNIGLNLSGSFGGYFVLPKGELWNEWKRRRHGLAAKLTPRRPR